MEFLKRKEMGTPVTAKQTVPELYFHLKFLYCLQQVSLIFPQLNPLFSIAVDNNDTYS